MTAAEKRTKIDVAYTTAGTKSEHCSICDHYIAKDKCEVVQGTINPGGWCKLFRLPGKTA
jgi:hypothetical protein